MLLWLSVCGGITVENLVSIGRKFTRLMTLNTNKSCSCPITKVGGCSTSGRQKHRTCCLGDDQLKGKQLFLFLDSSQDGLQGAFLTAESEKQSSDQTLHTFA